MITKDGQSLLIKKVNNKIPFKRSHTSIKNKEKEETLTKRRGIETKRCGSLSLCKKEKDDDLLGPQELVTLSEFLPRNFLDGHPQEVFEVITCHVVSIVEADNNHASFKEVNNSNEIKKKTSVFDRIKLLTTQSSVFQRLSTVMKEKENQYPTFTFT